MSQSSDPNNDGRRLVESIKEKISIVDIVSRYVSLSKAGKNYKGNCPFHGEKTPSFNVNAIDGYWKCFGCGKGGDVITFVQEIEHTSFKEALAYLAEIAGVELRTNKYSAEADSKDHSIFALLSDSAEYYKQELQKSTEVADYLHSRGINDAMINEFSLGYAPDQWQSCYNAVGSKYSPSIVIESGIGIQGNKGIYDRFRSRIMFPTLDIRGRVTTFSGRIWPPSGPYQTERPDAGKYVNGPETAVYHKSKTLYGIYQARQGASQKKRMIIVEGHLDCIMAHQIGLNETVAIAGTAFTEDHASIVKRYCNHIILAFDGDAAGQKAILRSLPTLYEHGFTVTIASLPAGVDPADSIKLNPNDFIKAVDESTDYVTYRLSQLQSEGAPLEVIERVLKDELYPLLALLDNTLHIESAIKTISRITALGNDSIIREHIKKAGIVRTNNNVVGTQQRKEHVPPTIRELLVKVMVIWQELDNKENHSQKMLEYIKGSTGITVESIKQLAELFEIVQDDYDMKFDWLYGKQQAQDLLSVALKQFSEAYIRDTMQRQLTSLHQVVDHEEHNKIEQKIISLSHYKRYIETHSYDN